MKLSLQNLPDSKIKILIELSAQEFQEFIERAIEELSQDLVIEGFRKGKVPKEIAMHHLAKEQILERALQRAVEKSYLKVIFENKIEAISQPKIEITKTPQLIPSLDPRESFLFVTSPFAFEAEVQILPSFDLPDYKKIASNVKRRKIEVEEKEVEDTLNWLQKSRAKRSQVLSPAQKGNFVEIEFSSPQIGTAQPQKDAFILGQGHLIPGFEENLEGMRPGEEKEFSLIFPTEHFQKDLAGKKIKFLVRMKSVQKIELPEINDDFAKELGRFENLQKLKESIREGIYKEKEIAESQRIRGEILDKIIEATFMELPEILIEREKERMVAELRVGVEKKFQIPFRDYLQKIKKTETELKNSFSEPAKKRVKSYLLLKEIAKKENIEVTEEEIETEINKFLKYYPSKEKAERELDIEQLKVYNREMIKNEKTLARLESFAKQD